MDESLGLHPVADTHFGEQVDGLLLKNSGAHALFYVLAAAGLNYDGFDSVQIQQMGQHQSRGSCSNDPDLRALWSRHWNGHRQYRPLV